MLVCTQLPMTVEDAEALLAEWQGHPHVEVHILGESLGGRKLHRVTITDPQGNVPPSRRWVHHAPISIRAKGCRSGTSREW